MNPILSDSFSGVSLDVLTRLVGGICGKLDRGLIANAAELIASILTRTPDSHEFDIQMSSILLQNGSFCLGKQAELTTLSAFRRCSQGQLSTTELAIFLQDIWDLHQVEDTSVLPFSDQVARFVRRYSS